MRNFSKLNCKLTTERLFLRPLKVTDAEAMWPYVSDPDFPKYMSWEAHKNISETKEFLRKTKKHFETGEGITWAIFQNDVFCGVIGLAGITWKLQAWKMDTAELGYWLGTEFWNKGFMTEAARAVVQFGFEKIGLNKITVGHVLENSASRCVIEKLGFRLIGIQKEHFFRYGKWWDHKTYELLRSNFG